MRIIHHTETDWTTAIIRRTGYKTYIESGPSCWSYSHYLQRILSNKKLSFSHFAKSGKNIVREICSFFCIKIYLEEVSRKKSPVSLIHTQQLYERASEIYCMQHKLCNYMYLLQCCNKQGTTVIVLCVPTRSLSSLAQETTVNIVGRVNLFQFSTIVGPVLLYRILKRTQTHTHTYKH